MEKLESKIDNEIEKYVNLMMRIIKEFPTEISRAYEIYTNIWLDVYMREDNKILAYELAYKGLENFYYSLIKK